MVGDEVSKGGAAAVVAGTAIGQEQVERGVVRVLGDRTATPQARWQLQAEVLEHLVKQRLILLGLARRGEACGEQDIELALRRLAEQLARQEKTLADYYRDPGRSEDLVREALRWELTWSRYVVKTVTDDYLKRMFEQRRREFDGTRLRVAHILFPTPPDRVDLSTELAEAARVRGAILSGATSFERAAREHSRAPTAQEGGVLGWIGREEPMPEPFSREAYRLEVGDVSLPVVSPAGVHLIRCLEIEAGTATWEDARARLVDVATRELFDKLAEEERPRHNVEYTGVTAYFRPGTREVVVPLKDSNGAEDR